MGRERGVLGRERSTEGVLGREKSVGKREECWGEREALKECWEGRRVLGRERSVGIREEHWEERGALGR